MYTNAQITIQQLTDQLEGKRQTSGPSNDRKRGIGTTEWDQQPALPSSIAASVSRQRRDIAIHMIHSRLVHTMANAARQALNRWRWMALRVSRKYLFFFEKKNVLNHFY
jgi:hypothetical protein